MKRERKRYTSEYKAELALEVVKGQRTLNEIAIASGVYEAQLYEEIGRGTPWIQGRVRLAEKMPACLAAGERRQLVEWEHSSLSLVRQWQLLGLARSGLYIR